MLNAWELWLTRLARIDVRLVAETGQIEGLYLQAWRMMRAGENKDALQLLAQVTKSAPEFADAYEAYG